MPSLSRRQMLGSLGASLGLQAAQQRPNIVLILADDLGLGDLGCYGQKVLQTPNIDRLATEGTRFTNAYAGAQVCAPSRCTLMTGYHLGHASVRGNWEVYPEGQAPLAERDVTVAALLQTAGYATGLCGKWGLGSQDSRSAPNRAGFDFFYGYNCQRHAHRFYTDYLYRNQERVPIPQSAARRVYAQDRIADESLRFIRDHRSRPFFLFCAWTVPHGPYNEGNVPSVEKYRHTGWSTSEQVYATMVDRLDSDVGRVLAALKELNLEQNTIVLFASDNGPAGGKENNARFGSQAGLREFKGSLREGGIRAPLIARWPGRIAAGRTTPFPTAFWDFLPTAAELAGATPPGGIDGVSIVPTLLGRSQTPRDYLYWERASAAGLTQAVRMGDWKAYQEKAGAPIELYNLAADPAEARDVSAAQPALVARARKIMAEARTDIAVPPADPRVWEKYREDNKRLDELLSR